MMTPNERAGHISAASRGNSSLRKALDDVCSRLDALESHDESAGHGGKSERGKIKATVTRLETRVKALEAGKGSAGDSA